MSETANPRAVRPRVMPLPHDLCWMLSSLHTAAAKVLASAGAAGATSPAGTPDRLRPLLPELSEAPSGRLDYRIAVVAPMKAGKSTLLNAVLSRELLPSRGPAMTVLPTCVVPVAAESVPEPVLTVPGSTIEGVTALAHRLARPGHRPAVATAVRRHPQLAAAEARLSGTGVAGPPHRTVGTRAIRAVLAEVNDLLRLALTALAHEDVLVQLPSLQPPEVVVPVPWMVTDPAGGWLVLVDTPGPDEELPPGMLDRFVRQEIHRAHELLLVTDATRRDNEAEHTVTRMATSVQKPVFTVVNRVDLADDPRNASSTPSQGSGVRTAARQGLAAASVLRRPPDGERRHEASAAERAFLRTAFPLDWEHHADVLSGAEIRNLARRQWEQSGVPALLDQLITVRARNPGAWALADLLSRIASVGDPAAAVSGRPLAPRDGITVLASRRQQLVERARSLYVRTPITWR
ncbi:dynamin family protein [Streptomyces purpurascens]|uniref:Dynamin family protein n=1 Tax=Streptomyces purpurascens TaxID=1924 RepID=A0ABZ1MGX3_STREF|nr:dynamin family protein [Streptomyces purpurascens]MCE7049385.1 dynamin family protein [Streptomyces purpurascens]